MLPEKKIKLPSLWFENLTKNKMAVFLHPRDFAGLAIQSFIFVCWYLDKRFNKLIRLQKRKLFILHLCCLPIDCTKKMWVSTKYKSCRESHGIHYSATWLALKLFFKLRVSVKTLLDF